MSEVIIKVEDLSKLYRLGEIGTGTLSHDLNRWWARVRGKEDPFAKVGHLNDQSAKAEKGEIVWALKDINFDIKQGEVLGIIGKNGAGKSTLLKILSQVTTPTTGNIKVKGRIASLLEVGTGFHPELTGRENIFLNGAILGMTKTEIRSKFDEILDFAGVAKYIDTPVKRYSSGMYVRLAFAVAAHLDPEILIVDEVLAVGDADFQKKCLGKMRDVAGQGRTVLFVSHNMGSIKALCNTGIVITNGNITYKGNAEDAINNYLYSNESPITNLNNRKDRSGNQFLKFIDVVFKDKDDHVIHQIISGNHIKLELNFELNKPIKDYFFALNIYDKFENLISLIASDELGFNFNSIEKNGKIVIDIPRLTLRGGKYKISIFSSQTKGGAHDLIDVIENAFELNVLDGDFWQVGKLNRQNGFLIDSKIGIESK